MKICIDFKLWLAGSDTTNELWIEEHPRNSRVQKRRQYRDRQSPSTPGFEKLSTALNESKKINVMTFNWKKLDQTESTLLESLKKWVLQVVKFTL